ICNRRAGHARPLPFPLEVELEHELDASSAVEVIGVTEVLVRQLAGGVEAQGQVGIAARRIERRQRMVDEVICRDAELDLLVLRNLEVLEERQVAVPERRRLYIRENEGAIVTR